MTAITMEIGGIRLEGELLETEAARALADRLPVELRMSRWGDEYYGDLGVSMGPFCGAKVEVLEVGALAFWEPGNALCLFFGPTPASRGSAPEAASPVHELGRVRGDWAAVKTLGGSVRARLELSPGR